MSKSLNVLKLLFHKNLQMHALCVEQILECLALLIQYSAPK